MIEGKNSLDNLKSPSSIDEEYSFLDGLIDSSDNVNVARLDSVLEAKKITQEEYVKLVRKLMKKGEWVEDALANVGKKLETQVEELGIDPVTKLFKRDLLEQKFSDLIKELNFKSTSEKMRRPPLCAVIVIAIDLDNLKIWNDTYSHFTGDKALRTIANSLKEVTRDGDYIFRLGDKSDEIIVTVRIKKELKSDKLEEIFEKIKNKINSEYLEVNNVKLPVTAAAGYVILKQGELRNLDQILEVADKNQSVDKEPEVKKQRIEKATANLNRLN